MHALQSTIGVALGLLAATSTAAFAQTADFKCPPNGTVVENTDGSGVTWIGPDGNGCRLQPKGPDGKTFPPFFWFAPGATASDRNLQTYESQVKPAGLWPLSVGKIFNAHYEGEGATPGYNSKWNFVFRVERFEKITTKAGTFDAFVVVYQSEQMAPSTWKATTGIWYAPVPGVTVKSEYADNEGKATSRRNSEAASIR